MTARESRRTLDPAPVATPAATRQVRIADPDSPGDILLIRLRWLCPVPTCRRPRGEPELHRVTYHAATGHVYAQARIHLWHNPCGHHQLTRDLIAEANNGLPHPRSTEDHDDHRTRERSHSIHR